MFKIWCQLGNRKHLPWLTISTCLVPISIYIKLGADLARIPGPSLQALTDCCIILNSYPIVSPGHGSACESEVCLNSEGLNTNDIPERRFFVNHFGISAYKPAYGLVLLVTHRVPQFRCIIVLLFSCSLVLYLFVMNCVDIAHICTWPTRGLQVILRIVRLKILHFIE